MKDARDQLREGMSLRAKFFRWKDRSMNGVSLEEFVQAKDQFDRIETEYLIKQGPEALRRLRESPDDLESYRLAVEYLRSVLRSVKAAGFNVLPDEPEEE